jgi:hypothetical protein
VFLAGRSAWGFCPLEFAEQCHQLTVRLPRGATAGDLAGVMVFDV